MKSYSHQEFAQKSCGQSGEITKSESSLRNSSEVPQNNDSINYSLPGGASPAGSPINSPPSRPMGRMLVFMLRGAIWTLTVLILTKVIVYV